MSQMVVERATSSILTGVDLTRTEFNFFNFGHSFCRSLVGLTETGTFIHMVTLSVMQFQAELISEEALNEINQYIRSSNKRVYNSVNNFSKFRSEIRSNPHSWRMYCDLPMDDLKTCVR